MSHNLDEALFNYLKIKLILRLSKPRPLTFYLITFYDILFVHYSIISYDALQSTACQHCAK